MTRPLSSQLSFVYDDLGLVILRPVKTLFIWGLQDPFLPGFGRDPVAFGAAKTQFFWVVKSQFL
ncbi:hypothetical protein NC651_000515 [Populus alba x Populus x berolinensis]|nr:hypothetical protein NC651_000515 [Populus alba x Populus x berolinensis]